MRRRQFFLFLGSATAWPVLARAQRSALPVIGFLHIGKVDAYTNNALDAFRRGLRETGGETALFATATPGKQELPRLPSRELHVIIDRLTGVVGEREPHWAACLPLTNGCSVERVAIWRHVIHADGNDVTAAQLAVYGELE